MPAVICSLRRLPLFAALALLPLEACRSHPPGPEPRLAAAPLQASGPNDERTISIGTFNIQDFGTTKASKPEILSQLAAIARTHDVLAVQEISDVSGAVPDLFLEEINRVPGSRHAIVVSPRTGQQPDDRISQEQVAFVFDTASIEQLGHGELFDDNASDWFQREPFAARFHALGGSFTFALVTVHTKPKVLGEIAHLHEVVAWARATFGGEDDIIVLGDLNASCRYAKTADLDTMSIRGPEYRWIVPDDADTTVGPSHCAYDRIIMTSGAWGDYANRWGVDAVSTSKTVSDHWPVWAAFFVGRDGG